MILALALLLSQVDAGADVLFAPGLSDLQAIRRVCGSVSKPVNVVNEVQHGFSVAELASAGVKRISTGTKLACLAYGSLIHAAREMSEDRTFGFTEQASGYEEIASYFRPEG